MQARSPGGPIEDVLCSPDRVAGPRRNGADARTTLFNSEKDYETTITDIGNVSDLGAGHLECTSNLISWYYLISW